METLTKESFEKKVVRSKKMVVVDFSGKDCQPCRRLKPVMKKINQIYKDKDYIEFYEVEMKDNPEIFSKWGVMTIPHLIFFFEGKVVDELIGFKGEDAVLEFIKRNVVSLSQPPYFAE